MKKHALNSLIISLLIAILLTSCAPASSYAPSAAAPGQREFMLEAPQAFAVPEAAMDNSGSQIPDVTGSGAIERIVIKNGDLSIVVADPAASMGTIGQMAEGMGGYIVSSQLYKTITNDGVEVPVADITVRVPAERLTEAMDQVKSLVDDLENDVLSESVSGQDVTKEYTDLQSRLRNLQNAETRLEEIMESATRTEDVLNTYNELTRVQEQIEVIKGQIKYYDEASQLSSLHVNVQSQESIKPLTIGTWQPQGVARDALQALIDALKFLANAAIWGVIFCLPVAVIVGIPAWFIFKRLRKWARDRKALKQTASPTEVEKQ